MMQTKVQAVLSDYLTQESLSIAFQDCFMVFTAVFVVAALASLCIPGSAAKKS
jgi:succinate dehydrogenase hydrophobic anchor subunit